MFTMFHNRQTIDDGAPCHRGRVAENFKVHHFGQNRIFRAWAGYSPDRNLIESVWGLVWQEVNRRQPTTLPGLKRAIDSGWNRATPDYLRRLFESQDRRDDAILAKKRRPYGLLSERAERKKTPLCSCCIESLSSLSSVKFITFHWLWFPSSLESKNLVTIMNRCLKMFERP